MVKWTFLVKPYDYPEGSLWFVENAFGEMILGTVLGKAELDIGLLA